MANCKVLGLIPHHQWGRWTIEHRGELYKSGSSIPHGIFIIQMRQCENCGKHEIRKEILDDF